MWQIWLIIAGVFFIGEAITVGFLVFWLGIGALFASLASLFIDNLIIQTVIFVVSSTLLILITKPFVKKFLDRKTIPTNAYAVIGRHGVVTKDINNMEGTGQIKVSGEVWTARSDDDNVTFSEGNEIEVVKIDGVKAIVKQS